MTSPPSVECAPDACTLPVSERPLRVAEFSTLFATSLRAIERVDETRVRMELSGDDAVRAAVTDLTARESECCSFFSFTVTGAGDHIDLDVSVPPSHADVLDGLARLAAGAAGLRP
jgi:hypothetical protein